MAKLKTNKGDFHYKNKALYLGIKRIDKVIALENLKLITETLSQAKITCGPAFGTLLGMVREHDFIEWDEDIDLYILQEEEQQFRDAIWALQEQGFELIRYERRGLYSMMRKGEYTDFYVFAPLTKQLRHTNGGGYILDKYIQESETIDFKGIPLNIPKEYDEYLTFQYGNWREPVKYANFEISKPKIWGKKIAFYTKLHLPDFLYFFLLKHYHKKSLRRFIEKCNKKGITLSEL